MIHRALDERNNILALLKEGMKPGLRLGLPNLDRHYSVRLGKTFFVLNILCALTRKHKLKHFLFTPEMGEPKEVFALLIEILTGRRFQHNKPHRVTEKQVEDLLPFLHEYFFVFDTQDTSPDLATALKAVDQSRKELEAHTFTIDNYNDLKHHEVKMIDLYNEEQIVTFNKACKNHRMHGFLTAHPRNLVNLADMIEPPSPDKIKGGSAFWSKGQTIIGLHRQDSTLEAKFWKIKPRVVGERGSVFLGVDFERSTYYEIDQNGYDKQYLFEQDGWPAKQKLIPLDLAIQEDAPF